MMSKAEPVDLHLVALSDPDLDRLWVCVRHCRRQVQEDPASSDLAQELIGLENLLKEIGR